MTKLLKNMFVVASVVLAINANAQYNICLFNDTASLLPKGAQSSATADFNKDGKPDLVFIAHSSEKLCVLLGNGDGTFGAPTNYQVQGGSFSVITDDLNSDGNSDIIYCQFGVPSMAVVMLGNGNGTFSTPVAYDAEDLGYSMTTGDFNNDNKIDVAISSIFKDNFSVLFGDGNGGLSTATHYAVGNSTDPIAIAAADVNADGYDDIVTANYKTYDIAVFLSTGTSFTAPTYYPVSDTADPFYVLLNDYNYDGKADICVSMRNSDSLAILFGTGNGSFGIPTKYSTGSGTEPDEMITKDINADGRDEIITANSKDGSISILVALGNGTFSSPLVFPAGGKCRAVASGDFNNDGYNDIAVGNDIDTATYSIILNALPSLKTTVNNATISAEQAGATYQWIDCNTKMPIPGATQKDYTATVNGSYAVVIDRGGCGDTSACKQVTIPVSTQNVASENVSVKIFPNPVGNTMYVDVSSLGNISYKLYYFTGAIVYEGLLPSTRSIDVRNLAPGIYTLQLNGNNLNSISRFAKH